MRVGGHAGLPETSEASFGELASDITCINTSTRPALTPFIQYNRTFIFVGRVRFLQYTLKLWHFL